MGKKEKEVVVKERPSYRTTKQSSKSKADTTAKKKRSVKNVPPVDPQEVTAGTAGDVETGSHNSRKDSKEEATKDVFTPKPTGNDQQEWNSEAVRNAKLLNEGFSCCLILVMEDSPQLSKYGEFLLRAVESGVRRKFTCISGAQTAERVKRFLVSSGQREGQAQDDSYMERQDIFAEAVKLTMLGIKDAVSTEIDADIFSREMELAGARSKDYVRYVPPITVAIQNNEAGGAGDPFGIREPPPPPPPTEVGTTQQPRKKSKTGKIEEIPDDQSTTKDGARNIGVKTRMRKRGEVPLPEFEVIDDTPIKGPRSYVLLQGFYNPRIIDELRKIGVIVDGILLMTDESVTKYNFSILDVEDSIPGTFRPRNVLPQYLKAMERLPLDPETQNANVTKFWATLAEMYNSAPAESPFHDIALMNFKLPEENKQYLDSPDGLTFYVSKVFDEVAKRVYEMLVLEEWFHEFTSAADVTQLQPLEPSLPHDIYDQIVENIPAECMSVTILLEAVVQQVTYTLDLEAGLSPPPPCYEEDILAGLKMGKSTFGKTDWGITAKPGDPGSKKVKGEKTTEGGDGKVDTERTNTPLKSQPLFKTPMYIKSGDYASIRSCHLNGM
ncbi:unnamed protein product [Orchesella dallaii]|uniref:Sperm-associated antigen 17 n=1 Tax=Orchesella dallaii TaxID=48710 RepID=A0ABP1S4F2_9HEXA